ncbi:hypothetical protein DXT99_11620 [Pontibacter diazotrophicus]|uniref:Uncharacterized protein n=1 Tax=Pontibacter diazotrophicus TaxID=1400979 RepID=A0A3D8LDA7_9BACT|nr:hypothetical protein [Pontibacter diazotrophicus]RDV14932.1 hypothetical protein DXT99_11620 [Pontibacter diazotrophicus]
MQHLEEQVKTRHYPKIARLAESATPDLNQNEFRRHCVAISVLQEYMTLPSDPCLIPSADGALDALVLNMPAFALQGQDNPLWKANQDLLLKLPADTKLYIMIQASVEGILQEWLEEHNLLARATIYTVPAQYEKAAWSEDEYTMVVDAKDEKVYMVQPHTNRKAADEYVCYHASRHFGWERIKVPLYFESGNILVGDNFFLLGADHAVDTFLDLNELVPQTKTLSAGKALIEPFQRYLDQERALFFVGSALQIPSERKREFYRDGEKWTEIIYQRNKEGTSQPTSYLNLFLTLAGRNGDGRYRVLVGDPQVASELLGNATTELATPEVFDNIAEVLERLGFEVIRNPLPLIYVDDEKERLRQWYFASYNNALVEIRGEQDKTVWMPTYGHGSWQELEVTDRENEAIWQRLGFKVIRLGDHHPFAAHSGVLQLIKGYVRKR